MRFLFLATLIALSGCAATVKQADSLEASAVAPSAPARKVALQVGGDEKVESSKDWQSFLAEWRVAMAAATSNAGLDFTYFEGTVPVQPEATILVRVKVNNFRYVAPGSRYGFGVMTGNAYMNLDVDFIELPMNKPLATRKYSTSSSAWEGIFSAMTDKQVRAVSDQIVNGIMRR